MREAISSVSLVVDDSEPGRYARTHVLQRAGFHVLEATTGKDALRQIADYQPALFLLDVKLPDMDGFSVCRAIKKNPATARTMVLQISSYYTSTSDQVQGLEDGADGYIPGDVAPELLVARVRSLLKRRCGMWPNTRARRT